MSILSLISTPGCSAVKGPPYLRSNSTSMGRGCATDSASRAANKSLIFSRSRKSRFRDMWFDETATKEAEASVEVDEEEEASERRAMPSRSAPSSLRKANTNCNRNCVSETSKILYFKSSNSTTRSGSSSESFPRVGFFSWTRLELHHKEKGTLFLLRFIMFVLIG